jgi:LmbE family N-acetylglucosaminyl deacetylase
MTVTDEADWAPWLASPELRPFPDERHDRAVLVAAHPDDETLGASGLAQHLHDRGTAVEIVVATDGEAAFPELSESDRQALGRRRRRELRESLYAQGMPDVPVHWLGLPDSALAAHRDTLADRLTGPLADADVCFVPWPGDPHPDHQAVAEVALDVAPVTTHRWSYPIWMWHWLRPDQTSRHVAFTYHLDDRQRRRKAAGLAAFVSQRESGPGGRDPILPPDMLRHFERNVEVVFREPPRRSAPISRFERLYGDGGDPWQVTTKWYERRKRANLLAALPDERYGTAVEPACGTGALTRELAARCDHVLAFDPVAEAVRRCREHTAGLPNVHVSPGALPADLPAGPVDLVVFSEILYYLDDDDLAKSVQAAVDALRPGGCLAAVHWLPWAAEAPRDGMAAHEYLIGHPALCPVVQHVDERFVLHVTRRR